MSTGCLANRQAGFEPNRSEVGVGPNKFEQRGFQEILWIVERDVREVGEWDHAGSF